MYWFEILMRVNKAYSFNFNRILGNNSKYKWRAEMQYITVLFDGNKKETRKISTRLDALIMKDV